MGLCLPATDSCKIGPFSAENTAADPSWPDPDIPLSKQPFLGQMLSTNNKNENGLGKHLDLWLKDDNSTPFSNHSVAVDAGLHFLNSSSNDPFGLLPGEFV